MIYNFVSLCGKYGSLQHSVSLGNIIVIKGKNGILGKRNVEGHMSLCVYSNDSIIWCKEVKTMTGNIKKQMEKTMFP